MTRTAPELAPPSNFPPHQRGRLTHTLFNVQQAHTRRIFMWNPGLRTGTLRPQSGRLTQTTAACNGDETGVLVFGQYCSVVGINAECGVMFLWNVINKYGIQRWRQFRPLWHADLNVAKFGECGIDSYREFSVQEEGCD
ncbi:hypothetical protein AVEN_223872-1 [Araneus ventricosus]|uniref:Uncharacterized protein n=1 Tax=Araneus ventricosus TaxID=182803 RepID=A0A4Y2QJ85_ARAVE|nr:hypothetical protein AVEN_223872-1 [Araneus ventricosus]